MIEAIELINLSFFNKLKLELLIEQNAKVDSPIKKAQEPSPISCFTNLLGTRIPNGGGIYHHVTGDKAGGHAVRMVGWGVEGGVKYWKVGST